MRKCQKALLQRSAPEDAQKSEALIGPNAILQFLPLLDETFGVSAREALLQEAMVMRVPDGSKMIPEGGAVRLQQILRHHAPRLAPVLAEQAGAATADYILAHRIPAIAQRVLKLLPRYLSAQLLSRAISAHAWTFVGSGVFEAESPWLFCIRDNPMVRSEFDDGPLCDWHAAVFTRLYQVLVGPDLVFRETECCAQPGVERCRFECVRMSP